MSNEQTKREDLAVGLAEVRTEIRALNTRFDSFAELLDAKLAPLQRWMDGQQTVCSSHDQRMIRLEAATTDLLPAVQDHEKRLQRVEHVSANTRLVGGAAWAIIMLALGGLANLIWRR